MIYFLKGLSPDSPFDVWEATMHVDTPVLQLKGIGPKTAERFAKMNIYSVQDLLDCLPICYRDLTTPTSIACATQSDGEVLLRVHISSAPRWGMRRGKSSLFSFQVSDLTGSMRVAYFNQSYLFNQFQEGQECLLFGRIHYYKNSMQMQNPKFYALDESGILPIYALAPGLRQKNMRAAVAQALAGVEFPEKYTAEFCEYAGLLTTSNEYRWMHQPQTSAQHQLAQKSCMTKKMLVFNAMLNQLERVEGRTEPFVVSPDVVKKFTEKLPFLLTNAQLRAMNEIAEDLSTSIPMNRVLQGDVGSGKTVVALFSAYIVAACGAQTLLMAPTELLAVQHYQNAQPIFGDRVALLTANTSASERREQCARLASGELSLLIGTHALLYAGLPCANLGLVIADEQHRFGVAQRAALGGASVNTLIMTATPIPRTLALTLYRKASMSVLDERPAGRQPVQTFIVREEKRADLYSWVQSRLSEGAQGYVVCPLVEPNEDLDCRSVLEVAAELARCLRPHRLAILHGRMSAEEKAVVMRQFREKEISLLVGTTVIEVGVDVPAATIMIVENAERFGLAQLHQLRGRVGRGSAASYCYLVSADAKNERLSVLKACNDGFAIAEKDLELRGPGELLGQRQHGAFALSSGNLVRNAALLQQTRALLDITQKRFPQDYRTVCEQAQQLLEHGQGGIVFN